MKIKVKLDGGAYEPTRAHKEDAGLDLRSTVDTWVHPGEHMMIDTGVHVQIPTGYVGLITSKSGLMGKGLTVRGTIDCGFVGSIKAVMFNHGDEGYLIHKGDKICQLVLLPIITPELELVSHLDETERGADGFGSTGR